MNELRVLFTTVSPSEAEVPGSLHRNPWAACCSGVPRDPPYFNVTTSGVQTSGRDIKGIVITHRK